MEKQETIIYLKFTGEVFMKKRSLFSIRNVFSRKRKWLSVYFSKGYYSFTVVYFTVQSVSLITQHFL